MRRGMCMGARLRHVMVPVRRRRGGAIVCVVAVVPQVVFRAIIDKAVGRPLRRVAATKLVHGIRISMQAVQQVVRVVRVRLHVSLHMLDSNVPQVRDPIGNVARNRTRHTSNVPERRGRVMQVGERRQ